MEEDNLVIDEELSSSPEVIKDQRIHKQLKIFWIILIILQGLNLVTGLTEESISYTKIFIGLIPFFFYYTIVIKKNPRFITWGLLYLVVTGLMTVGALFFMISALIGSGTILLPGVVVLGLISIIFGFVIWGIILHGKYRVE